MTHQPLGLREGHAPCSFALGASRWRCSLGYPHSMGIGKKWAPLATMDFELKKNGALVFFEPRKVRFKPTKGREVIPKKQLAFKKQRHTTTNRGKNLPAPTMHEPKLGNSPTWMVTHANPMTLLHLGGDFRGCD